MAAGSVAGEIFAMAVGVFMIAMGWLWIGLLGRPIGRTLLEAATPFRRRPLSQKNLDQARRNALLLIVAGGIGVIPGLIALLT